MSFVAFAHLAHTLGADGFGKLEFVLACLMFGMIAVESGFQTIGARDVAIDPRSAANLVSRILPIQLLIAATLTAVCFVLQWASWLDPTTARLLFGYSISLLWIPFFLTWVFQGQQRMIWVAVPQVLRQLCFLLVAWLGVRTTDDLLRLPYAENGSVLAAAALCLVVYLRRGQRLSLRRPWTPESRAVMRDAATIGTSQILWFVRMYFPIVMLKFILGDAEVGRFGAAHRIVNVFQVGVTVYWMSFFPQLSQHAGRASLQTTLMKSLTVSTSFMVCCAIGFSWFAPQIMQLAFGSGFAVATAATVLAIMVWRVPIIMFRSHARQALFVSRFQRDELFCSLLSVVVLLIVSYWATVAYGVVGLALAATLSELVGAIATWIVWLFRWRHSQRLMESPHE